MNGRAWNSTLPARKKGLARKGLRATSLPLEQPTGWPAGTSRAPRKRKVLTAARKPRERKPAKDTGPSRKVRNLVLARDDWQCVGCGRPVGGTYTWWSLQHRKARGVGGDNSPCNLVLLCGSATSIGCHRLCEDRDQDAHERGLWLRSDENPALVPVMVARNGGGITLWAAANGQWATEAPAGGPRECLHRGRVHRCHGNPGRRCPCHGRKTQETPHCRSGAAPGGGRAGKAINGGGSVTAARAGTARRKAPVISLTLGLVPSGEAILGEHPEWAYLATPDAVSAPPVIFTPEDRADLDAFLERVSQEVADLGEELDAQEQRGHQEAARRRPLTVAAGWPEVHHGPKRAAPLAVTLDGKPWPPAAGPEDHILTHEEVAAMDAAGCEAADSDGQDEETQ